MNEKRRIMIEKFIEGLDEEETKHAEMIADDRKSELRAKRIEETQRCLNCGHKPLTYSVFSVSCSKCGESSYDGPGGYSRIKGKKIN